MKGIIIKKNNFIAYLLIIVAIYLSANPIFHMIYYKQSVIVAFLISFSLFTLLCTKLKLKKDVILAVIFLIISIVGTILFTGTSEISTYISIILQILSALFITSIVDFDDFERVFVNIITFLMVCSLIFYFVQIIFYNIWTLFPLEQGRYFTYANVVYIYNYFVLPEAGNYIFPRNSGIFWEPGCYQFFLNMSLSLLINREKKRSKSIDSKTFYFVILYIVAMITTKSTTGLFLLILILLFNFKYISSVFRQKQATALSKISVFVVIIFAIVLFIRLDVITVAIESLSKVSSDDYMGGNGIITRLSLDSFPLLFENFYRIFGLSFEKIYSMNDYSVWNSIIEDALALGIPFVLIVLVGIFKYSMRHFGVNKGLIFIVFIASLSAEALFHTIILFIFMLYGYQKVQHVGGL